MVSWWIVYAFADRGHSHKLATDCTPVCGVLHGPEVLGRGAHSVALAVYIGTLSRSSSAAQWSVWLWMFSLDCAVAALLGRFSNVARQLTGQ